MKRDQVAIAIRRISWATLAAGLLLGTYLLKRSLSAGANPGCPTMACVGAGIGALLMGPAAIVIGSLLSGVFNTISLALQGSPGTFGRKLEPVLVVVPALLAVAGVYLYFYR